jgi:Domain of unknown function (DUF4169)
MIPSLSRLPAFILTGMHMGEIVNLKRFRKRVEREQAAQDAEANRARFGRSKSERMRDEKHKARADELLDQHLLDGGDAS